MSTDKRTVAPKDDMLLTRAQLAGRWVTCIKTIQRREKAGLRAMRLGRSVRYRLPEMVVRRDNLESLLECKGAFERTGIGFAADFDFFDADHVPLSRVLFT